MKKQEIKDEKQVIFFQLIKETLPKNHALVDEISDLLEISSDAAYRRIRGDTPLAFHESFALLEKYGNLLGAMLGENAKNKIQCFYTPLNINDDNNLMAYMNSLRDNLGKVKIRPENEIILSASDIPIFNLSMFMDLVYVKFYSWSKNVYGVSGKYEDFLNSLDKEEIETCYKSTINTYLQSSSIEIWSFNTIDNFLNQLNYLYKVKCFDNNKVPILICEQLMALIEMLQLWAEKGKKYPKDIPFKLYISDVGLENTFVLIKQLEKSMCLVKLYTVNSLIVTDKTFCIEMESWLRNIAQQSTLVSESSAIDRFNFFSAQRKKITDFMVSCFNGNH